ncbi:MAG: FitA-like ribbon-helix-helix domain-containing protein [Planctomycetota bacterium]
MANVTISLSDELLQASRDYAQRHGTSLNAMIRELLERNVVKSKKAQLKALFELADRAGANSRGWKWNREELYDV